MSRPFHRILFIIVLAWGAAYPTRASTVELLTNGNFSQPISSLWERAFNFYADNRFSTSRSPGGYAYLSNADGSPGNNLYGEIAQYVNIPANATQVTLSYWHRTTTSETSGIKDEMTVLIVPSVGEVETVSRLTNLNANTSYQIRSIDITRFAGQRVLLGFAGQTDGSFPTTFRIDDVSIRATVPDIPTAPGNLDAIGYPDFVHLSWSDNSLNENGFYIERKIGSGSWVQLNTVSAEGDEYNDYDIVPRTTYSYRVRAFNGFGTSSYSNEDTVNIEGPPGNFDLTNEPAAWDTSIPGPKVQLHWTESEDVVTYTLYRNGAKYLDNFKGNDFLNCARLTGGSSYTYYVRATNTYGFTDSNFVTVTMPSGILPSNVTLTGITISGPQTVATGSSGDYKATARYSDGTSDDVTNRCLWTATGAPINATGLARTAIGTYTGRLAAGFSGAAQPISITATFDLPGIGRYTSIPFAVVIGSSATFGMSNPQIQFLRPDNANYVWRIRASLYGSAFVGSSPTVRWTLGEEVLPVNGKDLDFEVTLSPSKLSLKAEIIGGGTDSRSCVFNRPALNEPGEKYPATDPDNGKVMDSQGRPLQFDANKINHGLIVLTHGLRGSGEDQWIKNLSNAISVELNNANKPVPNIVIFDWKDGATPTVRYGDGSDDASYLGRTLQINRDILLNNDLRWPGYASFMFDLAAIRHQGLYYGEVLADWMYSEINKGHVNTGAPIHMIGHSAGGFVVGRCSQVLKKQHNVNVTQITMLDTPLPVGDHFNSSLQPAPVDRYVTSAYGGIAPELLGNSDSYIHSREIKRGWLKLLIPSNEDHSYSHEWYKGTVPIIPPAPELDGFYYSPFVGNHWQTVGGGLEGEAFSKLRATIESTSSSTEDVHTLTGFDTFGNAIFDGTQYILTESENVGITKDISLPVGAQILRFRYQFTGPADGDYLVVYFGDNPPIYIGSDLAITREAPFYADVPLSGYSGLTGKITIKLVSRGSANSVLKVDQIALSVTSDADRDGLINTQETALGTDPLLADTDSDGLSDGVEMNVYHTNALLDDSDGDGMKDGQEITAGMDPNDLNSIFKLTGVAKLSSDGVTITWNGKAGKFYSVIRSDNEDYSNYTVVASNISGVEPHTLFTDMSINWNTAGKLFYKVMVQDENGEISDSSPSATGFYIGDWFVNDYTFTSSNGEITLTAYLGTDRNVVIPTQINGLPVTSIGALAFAGQLELISVTIPDGVTSIGISAFANCSSLTHINVDTDNSNYSSMDGVLFNKDRTSLIQCPGSKAGSFTVPQGVTSIGPSAFAGCSELTRVIIPDSVINISTYVPSGGGAFDGCSALTDIDVHVNNSSFSTVDGALFNKDQTLIIHYPVGKMGIYTIPDSVTNIGIGAFTKCVGLTSVTIPASVINIGDDAFSNCTALTSINFLGNAPSGNDSIFNNVSDLIINYVIGTQGWGSTFAGRPTWGIPYPIANTIPADGVGSSSARLRGKINPNGHHTSFSFQYGETKQYGSWTYQFGGQLNGSEEQDVSSQIFLGLLPSTTYHYRLVATNEFGTVYGEDATFITGPQVLVSTIAGSPNYYGPLWLNHPTSLAIGIDGIVFVADTDNNVISKVYPDGRISALAGSWLPGSNNGIGLTAGFNQPQGIAVDAFGAVYVADTRNHTIRKITSEGKVSTLAGIAGTIGSADGTGTGASFNFPRGVSVSEDGCVYVADTGNHCIRKIATDGVVTTLAGNSASPGDSDGVGAQAGFNQPGDLAIGPDGCIYVADTGNRKIRKISLEGAVTTLAGVGEGLHQGLFDGSGLNAYFDIPTGIAVDKNGIVYVADFMSNSVRKILQDGDVSTYAGTPYISGSSDGVGSVATFNFSYYQSSQNGGDVAVDAVGRVYVADSINNTIRKITIAPLVKLSAPTDIAETSATISGTVNPNGSATTTRFEFGLTPDLGSIVNVTCAPDNDSLEHTVTASLTGLQPGTTYYYRLVAENNKGSDIGAVATLTTVNPEAAHLKITYFIGSILGYIGSQDGPADVASLNIPSSIAKDYLGISYVADSYNNTIRKILPNGDVSTLAGLAGSFGGPIAPGTSGAGSADGLGSIARFNNPQGIAVDSEGYLYVADTYNHTIRKITPEGLVSTFAGNAGSLGSQNGNANSARFFHPRGIAVDTLGNVYVADSFNHVIRKILPDGVVSTYAGHAEDNGFADGQGGVARFNYPTDLAVDSDGSLIVADSGNNVIRKITPDGWVTTIAGTPRVRGSVDGTSSLARFADPQGITIDASGSILVADSGNNCIRKISTAGVVSTIAGNSISFGRTDGRGNYALFNYPTDVLADDSGIIYVVDSYNSSIRKIRPVTDYALNVSGNSTQGGSVSGSGIFEEGTSVSVFAAPSAEYNFINWTENGSPVSTATSYSFILTSNRDLVATFSLKPFHQWKEAYFSSAQINDPTVSGWDATPLADGFSNGYKFLFNIDPTRPMTTHDRAALPKVVVDPSASGVEYLGLTFRLNALAGDDGFILLKSPNLAPNSWETVTPDVWESLGTDAQTGDEIIRLKVDVRGQNKQFLQVIPVDPSP
jgi:sugar lactone lactonase YvrE